MRLDQIPRSTRFEIPRTELLAQLANSLDVQLVVLVAPSGYGKSTLLAQYARSTSRQVIWCWLGGAPCTIFDIATAIAREIPYVGEQTELLEPNPRTPNDVLARQLGEALNIIDNNIDLIIDQSEHLEIANWLGILADSLNEGHRLIISRYNTDGLRLARRLTQDQALVLDVDDLQFSNEETEALLSVRQVKVDQQVLNQLEGWPAGLALATANIKKQISPHELIREILETLPIDLQDALPELAVLDLWTEGTGRRFQPQLPQGWLKQLIQAGLPMIPLDHQIYAPHHFLRQVLQEELAHSPERYRTASLWAAQQAEEQNDMWNAVKFYAQAQEYEKAIELSEILSAKFRNRGEHQLTKQLLEQIPLHHLNPSLQASLAWVWMETGAAEQGEILLKKLYDEKSLTPAGHASLAMVYGRKGDIETQFRIAEEGFQLCKDQDIAPALYWPYAISAINLGKTQTALKATDHFLQWAHEYGDQIRQAEAWQLQAFVQRANKELEKTIVALNRAYTIYHDLNWPQKAAIVRISEISALISLGQEDVARTILDEIKPLEADLNPIYQINLSIAKAELYLIEDSLIKAKEIIRKIEYLCQEHQINPVSIGLPYLQVDFLFHSKKPLEAKALLDTLEPPQIKRRAIYHQILKSLIDNEKPDPHNQDLELASDAFLNSRRAKLTLIGPQSIDRPIALYDQPKSLIITSLGDFNVQYQQQPVGISLKKSKELLTWLALHGSGSRDELVTALWDGSSEERHLEYLRVAIRRLRAALRKILPDGIDPLPYLGGRYRLNEDLNIIIDANPQGLMPQEIEALQKQFTNYQKIFLPNMDTEWVTDLRRKCTQWALDLGLALMKKLESDHPTDAITICRQLLHLEPWCDSAHQTLIRSLFQLGRSAEAEQSYLHYQKTLQNEFNTQPDTTFQQEYHGYLTQNN